MKLKRRYDFTSKNAKSGKVEAVGFMELNSSEPETTLRFYGDIVSDSWERWFDTDKCPQDIVDFLGAVSAEAPLDIYINSGGGSVSGGIAIYNILKRHNGFKTVYIDAMAASIASVIAFCGDKITMLTGAQLMIHSPWVLTWGNANALRGKADALDVCGEAITDIYMKHVKDGVTREQIMEMMERETWLTGKQAVQYFNIEAEEGVGAAACASMFFERYENMPQDVGAGAEDAAQEKAASEAANEAADEAASKAQEKAVSETKNKADRINRILSDLDYI